MIQRNIYTLTQIWLLDTFSNTEEKFNVVCEKNKQKKKQQLKNVIKQDKVLFVEQVKFIVKQE